MISLWQHLRQRAEVLSLVLLALLPALLSSPGRMPGDTKLYLYLDPVRLISDARWSWDPRQFAGWVPHQTISYLWPAGPWFAVWDTLGVPDWVAHRLWLATLMATAGLGARWAARHLNITGSAAWVVGAVYQCSPFILAYVSRTSLMLTTYAALGWLVGLTVRAATRTGWRDAAWFALVVATVAAPNATATAMIAPAPALWLCCAAWSQHITWKRAGLTLARLGAMSLAVSVWWITMLMVQGRHGADVLGYSEALDDVSLTATSTEVLRGLGYWLFYVRDAFTYATTASIDYQASTRTIITSLAVPGLGLAGLALTRWAYRGYAIALLAVGMVLAVGVHPIDHPSPLMEPLAERSRSTLALALRSSTRAVPLVVLALALGAGALTTAVVRSRARRSPGRTLRWPAVTVVLMAVANLPALWRADLVDPALERDQDPPAAWITASALLDERPEGYRVLQLPGAEFGAFRWGYTVDPPLPGLTDRPLVTRDLLPLGSPAAMDLLYALDDRIQEGVLDPAAVAPVARLLGADVVWLSNDAAFDRFGTARPDLLSQELITSGQLGAVTDVGAAVVDVPVRPSLDAEALARPEVGRAAPPVQLVDVPRPVPIVRAAADTLVLAGSGDGIVDAASVGLIPEGQAVRYAASLNDPELDAALADATRVVVTDTDRRRAHHWRGSQQVWGFTEDAGPDGGVLEPAVGDARLPVFPTTSHDQQTIARQQGGLRARASAYGTPFTYQPEWRPWYAVDGDPTTAWLVADGVDAEGARLRLDAPTPVGTLHLVQPPSAASGRRITAVDVIADDAPPVRVAIDERSLTADGQPVDLAAPATTIDLVIRSTEQVAPDWRYTTSVGFAEIRTELPATQETVVLRSAALDRTPDTVPLDLVFTRWRTSPYDADRHDPERALDRSFTLGSDRTLRVQMTARLSARADDRVLADLLGWDGAVADRRLTGDVNSAGWAALDGDPTTAWRTPFDAAVGARWTAPLSAAAAPSSESLRLTQVNDGRHALITGLGVIVDDSPAVDVTVPLPDAAGTSIVALPVDLVAMLNDPAAERLTLVIATTNGATTLESSTAQSIGLPTGLVQIDHPRLTVATPAAEVAVPCRDDLVTLDGQAVAVRLAGSFADLGRGGAVTVTPCDADQVNLTSGPHRLITAPGLRTGVDIDRVVLTQSSSTPRSQRPAVQTLSQSRTSQRVEIGPCAQGCWLIQGQGYNAGWQARLDGRDLGAPQMIDGGFNGWWLEASATSRQIQLTWTPQRTVDLGLLISLIGVIACVVILVVTRRTTPWVSPAGDTTWFWDPAARSATSTHRAWVGVTFVTVGAAVTIAPAWGLVAGAVMASAQLLRRPEAPGVAALAVAASLGAVMLWRVRRDRPFPGPLWTAEFSDLHRPGLLVVALLVGSLLAARPAR